MRVLVLDDEKYRHAVFKQNLIGHEHVAHVYSYDELVQAFESAQEAFHVVYLDHDLAQEHYRGEKGSSKDGTDAASYIALLPQERRPNLAIVHSMNASGAQRMCQILADAGIHASRRIFGMESGSELNT